MRHGAILLLTDRPDRSAALALALTTLAPCSVVAGYEEPAPNLNPMAIVADLTLSRRESMGRLRALNLRGTPSDTLLICMLRSTTDQDLRRARDLGASLCLPAYTDPKIVAEAIRRRIAEECAQTKTVVQGVARATEALTSLFGDVRGGGQVSLSRIEAGLDPILSAVREEGLTRWLDKVWTHDDATYQHCLLVAGVAAQFVLFLGFRAQDREHFVRSALLHDLGKARIPTEILNKPGRLDADELAIMRTHPVIGYEILRDSGCDALTLGAVRHHHEMLDGSGYPDGLIGDQIGDTVRLMTICDIYAALTERRAYKPPMPATDAIAVLASMGDKLEQGLVDRFATAMLKS